MKYFLIVFFATLAICSAQDVSCGGNSVTGCEYKMFYIPRHVIISSCIIFILLKTVVETIVALLESIANSPVQSSH